MDDTMRLDATMRSAGSARLWSDTLWPVVAGVVTAAGVIGNLRTNGLLGLVLLAGGMWLLVSLMVWGAFSDSGLTAVEAARWGVLAAHVIVSAIGVLMLLPVAGWLLLAVWGLSSPPVTAWFGRRRDRRRGIRRAEAPPRRRGDQAVVDRTFEQIVRGFQEDA
jgi:hypothetical protein